MERDLALRLDDPYDEGTVESLKLIRGEEDLRFEKTKKAVETDTETDGVEVNGEDTETMVDGQRDNGAKGDSTFSDNSTAIVLRHPPEIACCTPLQRTFVNAAQTNTVCGCHVRSELNRRMRSLAL